MNQLQEGNFSSNHFKILITLGCFEPPQGLKMKFTLEAIIEFEIKP